MGPLVRELVLAFSQEHPDVTVDVTDLGTQFGLETLRLGETDIAMASWLPPMVADSGAEATDTGDPEPGPVDLDFWGQRLAPGWKPTVIARDGIAVIVHSSNPVDGLGLLQLQDLFSGRTYEWRVIGSSETLGVVEIVSREYGSGTRRAFETLVMDGIEVTSRAVVVPSSEAVVEYVASHRAAIGYVSMAFQSPEVKVLSIEGVLPTPQSANFGSYALSRNLWLLTPNPPSRPAADLVRFALSPVGQQIVGRQYGRIR
jgi:phosphate transport system substrate-binding protein